jgi:hypothetical protein
MEGVPRRGQFGCCLPSKSIVDLLFAHNSTIAFYGAAVSVVAIICLFFGQRMAKEYAGAAILVPYFLLTIVAIYLLGR